MNQKESTITDSLTKRKKEQNVCMFLMFLNDQKSIDILLKERKKEGKKERKKV